MNVYGTVHNAAYGAVYGSADTSSGGTYQPRYVNRDSEHRRSVNSDGEFRRVGVRSESTRRMGRQL